MNEELESALADDGMQDIPEQDPEGPGTLRRVRGGKGQTWDERRPRYAHNAGISAAEAGAAATHWNKVAHMNRAASRNAKASGDPVAQRYYREMADAANDAADAMEDMEHWAKRVQAHFSRPRGGNKEETA